MAGTTKVTVVLKMIWGPTARFVFHMASTVVDPTDPLILGLIAVLEGITRGKAIQIEISLSAASVASATADANYVSIDKALIRFHDAQGVNHSYKVPGPIPSIIESDKETIDMSDVDVLVYTAAVVTNAKTKSNDAISSAVSGHRVENRKPIKAGAV